MLLIPVTDGAPAQEPLSVAEARARASLPTGMSDAVVAALITAARQTLDGKDGSLRRALITQTWDLMLDAFPWCSPLRIDIPLPPIQQLLSVSYIDASGTTQTLDPSGYTLVKSEPARLWSAYGTRWPIARRGAAMVTIRFMAGYGDTGDKVPEPIRNAIALKVNALANGLSRDPTLRSENILEGLYSYSVDVTGGGAATVEAAIEVLVSTYRVRSFV